jgi:hypothetical protein
MFEIDTWIRNLSDYKIKAFRPWPERFLGNYFDNVEREFTAFHAGFSFPKVARDTNMQTLSPV